MTLLIVIIIIIHFFFKNKIGITEYIAILDNQLARFLGFFVGLSGLLICRIAQVTIGKSWRVGIDENTKQSLITKGIFKYMRNPTYTGLYLINAGVFIINPTFLYFSWILVFYIMMEFQVRCEEEYLESQYGQEYLEYCKNTKRYIPMIY